MALKKYKILITKKTRNSAVIEVKASCPMEARRIAVAVAKKQDFSSARVKAVEFEGKEYLAYNLKEEDATYPTEIIA